MLPWLPFFRTSDYYHIKMEHPQHPQKEKTKQINNFKDFYAMNVHKAECPQTIQRSRIY